MKRVVEKVYRIFEFDHEGSLMDLSKHNGFSSIEFKSHQEAVEWVEKEERGEFAIVEVFCVNYYDQ